MVLRWELYDKVFRAAAEAETESKRSNRRRHVDRIGATVWYDKKKARHSSSIRRTPMADKSNDPVAMWQNMIGEMEKGFNSFANQEMESPEFSKAVNQVGGATAGAQKQLGDLMEEYLGSMNLPSRAEMASMDKGVASVE